MWRKAGFDTEQTIAAALNLIQREFSYTLTPPVLGMMSLMNFISHQARLLRALRQ